MLFSHQDGSDWAPRDEFGIPIVSIPSPQLTPLRPAGFEFCPEAKEAATECANGLAQDIQRSALSYGAEDGLPEIRADGPYFKPGEHVLFALLYTELDRCFTLPTLLPAEMPGAGFERFRHGCAALGIFQRGGTNWGATPVMDERALHEAAAHALGAYHGERPAPRPIVPGPVLRELEQPSTLPHGSYLLALVQRHLAALPQRLAAGKWGPEAEHAAISPQEFFEDAEARLSGFLLAEAAQRSCLFDIKAFLTSPRGSYEHHFKARFRLSPYGELKADFGTRLAEPEEEWGV